MRYKTLFKNDIIDALWPSKPFECYSDGEEENQNIIKEYKQWTGYENQPAFIQFNTEGSGFFPSGLGIEEPMDYLYTDKKFKKCVPESLEALFAMGGKDIDGYEIDPDDILEGEDRTNKLLFSMATEKAYIDTKRFYTSKDKWIEEYEGIIFNMYGDVITAPFYYISRFDIEELKRMRSEEHFITDMENAVSSSFKKYLFIAKEEEWISLGALDIRNKIIEMCQEYTESNPEDFISISEMNIEDPVVEIVDYWVSDKALELKEEIYNFATYGERK